MPLFIADSSSFSVTKSPNVDVYVGPRKALFVVPRILLTSKSQYFEQILNEQLAEKPEAKVYLESDEPETFELLLNWMQSGSFGLYGEERYILSIVHDEKALGNTCHLFCDLYCLFIKLKVVMNGYELLEKTFNILGQGPRLPLQPRTIRRVLEELPEHSKLLEYVLQGVANELVEKRGHVYDYYAELLEGPNAIQGLVKALFIRMKEPRPDAVYL